MLARVDLGNGAFSDAPRLAAEQAQAVVAVASFHAEERYWQFRKGYVHAIDGRVTAWSSFTKLDPRDYPSVSKSTARELPKLTSSLGPRLPSSDPALTEAVEALRWWQDATEEPPLAAIVLHVRILELIASRATTNTAWYDFLASHFAAAWVQHQVLETLLKVVMDAVENYPYGQVDPSEHDELEALKLKVLGLASGKKYGFHFHEALAALPSLAGIYPTHDDLGRRIHTLADRLSSTAKLDAWCQALQERWTLALPRVRRIRNALAHGGPITPSCADTIDRLAQRLAAWALARTLEGLLDGRGVVTVHDDLRHQADAWRAGVPNAASVHDALFPP